MLLTWLTTLLMPDVHCPAGVYRGAADTPGGPLQRPCPDPHPQSFREQETAAIAWRAPLHPRLQWIMPRSGMCCLHEGALILVAVVCCLARMSSRACDRSLLAQKACKGTCVQHSACMMLEHGHVQKH